MSRSYFYWIYWDIYFSFKLRFEAANSQMNIRKIIFLNLLFISSFLCGQEREADSLKRIAATTTEDTTKVLAMVELFEYVDAERSDILTTLDSAIRISERIGFAQGIILGNNAKGRYYSSKGEYNKALRFYLKVLELAKEKKDIKRIAKCYNNIGIVYDQLGFYEKALDFYFKALKIKEELHDEKGIYFSRLNIAIVYYDLREYDKSLEYNAQVLTAAKKAKDEDIESRVYQNMGNNYSDMGRYALGRNYYDKAIEMFRKTGNKYGTIDCYSSIAETYIVQKDYEKGIVYANIADSLSAAEDYLEGSVKAKVAKGAIFIETGKLKEAEKLFLTALSLTEGTGKTENIRDCYNNLSMIYEKEGKTELAYSYYKKYAEIKDSLINDNKSRAIANMQENYQVEKQQQEISFLNKDKQQQSILLSKQKQLSYIMAGGLILASILIFFIFRSYRQKQRANEVITLQKEEVERQKQKVDEKNLIVEEKNKEILDSIHYAKRIQKAFLTSDNYLKKNLPDHFVLYKPKDIVSGDFYWSARAENKVYLAAADCTGHGVPGAFMSLVGISFLNEIVLERKITSPEKILNHLRDDIIKALNPEDASEEAKDGMDIAVLCFDFEKMNLTFAAANNPVYLIRENELHVFPPDKFPVGKYHDDYRSFTLQSCEIQKDDRIYCFTDGYADQFGGPLRKKYKYKQLKEKLLSIHNVPMQEQKQQLDQEIENWKKGLEQVDDMLIIGIHV